MIAAATEEDEHWHLHHSDCTSTLIYLHTNSRTLPTCDISLDPPTFPVPEAGDFVELILLYTPMLPSHIQCEYQNNHKKLHLQRLMLIFTPCLYLILFRQMLGSAFKQTTHFSFEIMTYLSLIYVS